MEDIGQHIQTYCLPNNQCCGEKFVRASNSYVKLCIFNIGCLFGDVNINNINKINNMWINIGYKFT